MEKRELVQEQLVFKIKRAKEWKERPFCTWEELLLTKGPLATDTIHEFHYEKTIQEQPSFGSMDEEDYPKTFYAPSVVVIRPRPETDEEFEHRMKEKVRKEKIKEEQEKLEYLRLKAKFENK